MNRNAGMDRYRTSTIRRTRRLPETPTKRHPIPRGPSDETTAMVLHRAMRDGLIRCEVCAEPIHGERALAWSLHHRKGRQGARTDHSPTNLLLVCGADNVSGCHGRIHQRRSEAQPAGWWITRHGDVDPASVPVLVDDGARWVYLTADGGYGDEQTESS